MSEGLRIVGFVEGLSNRYVPKLWDSEGHRSAAETLSLAMSARIGRMNERVRSMPAFGDRDLLTDEGRVDMEVFHADNGGPHTRERMERDLESVSMYERDFPGLVSPDKRFHDGELGEGAAFCVLNRFLGSRFLITRTSRYDDYRNLVDFMVVDLEKGGKPICAIDEIVGAEGGNPRIEKKKERLKTGAMLRYGIESKSEGGLVLGEYRQLPGVYAAIGRDDLKALFESGVDLSSDEGEPSEAERNFFMKIIGSMRTYVEHDAKLPPESPVFEFLRAAEECLSARTVIGQ